MKNLSFFAILLVILLSSCSKQENPLTPVESENASAFYLGKIGTQRVYEEVVKWFVPNTDSPFIFVPDSLLNIIKLSKEELKEGIVSKKGITQDVDSIPYSYYTQWNLPHPFAEYKELNGRGIGYELDSHLKAISEGKEYLGFNGGYSWGTYIETDDSINAISYPYGIYTQMLKPLKKDLYWIDQEWEYVNSTTGDTETQNVSAKVIGEVDITVKAGNFKAYKIEIDYNWPDLNYTVIAKYEYYVPNIGLALEEWDRIDHIATLNAYGNNTTIVVRTVGRNELVSYNIIK
jgi:hypothetical protein